MSQFFIIEPEVAGSLGPRTVMDRSVHPPIIHELHYQFEGWLGDEIVQSFPCILVTKDLLQRLLMCQVSGFQVGTVEVSTSEEFRSVCPNVVLPQFEWLKIIGAAGKDDFGVHTSLRLVVSSNALAIIRENGPIALDVMPFVG